MAVDKAHPEAGFVEFEPVVIGIVDFVFVLIALAALLLVGAGWVWGWLIVQLFGGISILGFHPFNALGNAIEGAMASIARPLIKRIVAFGHAAWSIVMVLWRFVYVVTQVLGGIAIRITAVAQNAISGLVSVRTYVDNQIKALALYTEGLFGLENQTIAGVESQLLTDISRAEAASNTFAQAMRDQAIAIEKADVGNLRNTLNGDVASLNQTLRSDVLNLSNTIANDVRTINATITRDVTDLRQADATNLRTAENFATGLVSGLGIGTLRQTLTGLQSQVSKIATETTECLDPLCDTVTPQAPKLGNLGKYLKLLENLGVEAFFLALTIEAVRNPKAVADDMELVLEPLGDLSITVIRDTIGL